MTCTHPTWVRKGDDNPQLEIEVTPKSHVLTYSVALRQIDLEGDDPTRGRTFTPRELKQGVQWPLRSHHRTLWFLTTVADGSDQTATVHVTIRIRGEVVFDSDCGLPGDGLDGFWRATTWVSS